jgi:putative oxidoreductase
MTANEVPMTSQQQSCSSGVVARARARFAGAADSLQAPFLLAVRLYWGWQFAATGWGKLHNLARVTGYFASLGIPFPALNAPFVAGLEFAGGILLLLGLASRPVALLLAGDMAVAYLAADREALFALFRDPDKFYAAAPYTFLFASLIILVFGAGAWSLDRLRHRLSGGTAGSR